MSAPRSLDSIAKSLDQAARTGTTIMQVAGDEPLSVSDAYKVQRLVVGHRLARGDRHVGVKLGFTSTAKRAQMGVCDVIIGELTGGMRILDGASLNLDGFAHPRVEPEVAFRLGRDVDLSDPTQDVEAAIDAVAPAFEIIDSRYQDFRFQLADVVADNASAAAFVLGPWQRYGVDLANRGVIVEVDGRVVETGSTAAILGHPARALATASRLAAAYGLPLRAGTILLAGAARRSGKRADLAVPLRARPERGARPSRTCSAC